MKKLIIALVGFVLLSSAVMAGGGDCYIEDTNEKAANSLLWLVMSDLDMCQNALKDNFLDNVSAIGHINNAQSALRKAQFDSAYNTLFAEIDKRLTKIKFYLLMNERRYAHDRIEQLYSIIRNVVSGSSLPGSYGGSTAINYNGGGNNSAPANGEKIVGPSQNGGGAGLIMAPSSGVVAVQ